jgi:hypothetical protein
VLLLLKLPNLPTPRPLIFYLKLLQCCSCWQRFCPPSAAATKVPPLLLLLLLMLPHPHPSYLPVIPQCCC